MALLNYFWLYYTLNSFTNFLKNALLWMGHPSASSLVTSSYEFFGGLPRLFLTHIPSAICSLYNYGKSNFASSRGIARSGLLRIATGKGLGKPSSLSRGSFASYFSSLNLSKFGNGPGLPTKVNLPFFYDSNGSLELAWILVLIVLISLTCSALPLVALAAAIGWEGPACKGFNASILTTASFCCSMPSSFCKQLPHLSH